MMIEPNRQECHFFLSLLRQDFAIEYQDIICKLSICSLFASYDASERGKFVIISSGIYNDHAKRPR